MSYINTVEFQ